MIPSARSAPARSVSWRRTPNPASAAVFANFTVVDMFATTVSGTMDAAAAMRRARQRVERVYRKAAVR